MMVSESARKKLSEEELFFYEDRVCGEADLVYRYCLSLTLNQESALKLLRVTFKDAAENLKIMIGLHTEGIRCMLLDFAYKENANSKAGKAGSSPFINFMKDLSPDHRTVIFGKDVAGLTIEQIGQIVGKGQDEVRKSLAVSREKLTHTF